jgi:GAF domain-containing protein
MIFAEKEWEEAIVRGKGLNGLMKASPISSAETALKTKGGGMIPVLLSVSAVRGNDGEQQGVVYVGSDLTEHKRAGQLLQALNEAARSMERALTPEEIFAAVAGELKKLGFSCLVFLTDESQKNLFLRHWSYETGVIEAAGKLVGLKREEFPIPIKAVDEYRKVVWERETVFIENVQEVIRQLLQPALPGLARRLARPIARMLKVSKDINAPLIVGDKVVGMLSVESDDLTADDVPAITAFAHQMASEIWK